MKFIKILGKSYQVIFYEIHSNLNVHLQCAVFP